MASAGPSAEDLLFQAANPPPTLLLEAERPEHCCAPDERSTSYAPGQPLLVRHDHASRLVGSNGETSLLLAPPPPDPHVCRRHSQDQMAGSLTHHHPHHRPRAAAAAVTPREQQHNIRVATLLYHGHHPHLKALSRCRRARCNRQLLRQQTSSSLSSSFNTANGVSAAAMPIGTHGSIYLPHPDAMIGQPLWIYLEGNVWMERAGARRPTRHECRRANRPRAATGAVRR